MSINIDHGPAFVTFWEKSFPSSPCPPVPKRPEDLTFTQRLTLQSEAPVLWQNLFSRSSTGSQPLPADTAVRRAEGRLEARDIPFLRAADLEAEAQALEAHTQRAIDQQLVDQTVRSQQAYAAERQRAEAWNNAGLLERLGHTPLSPEVIAKNRRDYGISS